MGGRLEARRGEGRRGGGWFADLVLTVMEEKKTNLTVTNEPSPLLAPTVSSLSAPSVLHRFLRNVCSPRCYAPTNTPSLFELTAVELYPLTS